MAGGVRGSDTRGPNVPSAVTYGKSVTVRRGHPAADLSVEALAQARASAGLTVTVALPARDEAATIGPIVAGVVGLVRAGLVDEIVVGDDGSTDATAAVAAQAGARVVACGSIDGAGATGKGEALWTTLAASTGDLVCWIDADLAAFDPAFVVRLLAPLVVDQDVDFVKGYYRRPIGDQPDGGGRVTELMARPLLARFFPELSFVRQPLAGEYAGTRLLLERLPYLAGWGVDVGLLLDLSLIHI